MTRWRTLLTEASRFLVVGGIATATAFVLFNILVHGLLPGGTAPMPDEPIPAYVVANTLGMVISYRLSRYWAFKDRPPRQPDGGRTAYVVINVATMALPVACLWVSRTVLGLDTALADNLAANGIGLVAGMLARFYLFRRFVFRRPITLMEMYDDPDELEGAEGLPAEGRILEAPAEPVGD